MVWAEIVVVRRVPDRLPVSRPDSMRVHGGRVAVVDVDLDLAAGGALVGDDAERGAGLYVWE
jgi:hypothetical protein